MISFSRSLPQRDQIHLHALNKYIKSNYQSIRVRWHSLDPYDSSPAAWTLVPIGKLITPTNLQFQEGDKNVINLSKKFKWSPAQSSLLCKGLTFVPTKGSNRDLINNTRFALQQYHRKFIIAAYFEGKGDTDPPPFTPKSNWTPPWTNVPVDIKKIIQKDLEHFDS